MHLILSPNNSLLPPILWPPGTPPLFRNPPRTLPHSLQNSSRARETLAHPPGIPLHSQNSPSSAPPRIPLLSGAPPAALSPPQLHAAPHAPAAPRFYPRTPSRSPAPHRSLRARSHTIGGGPASRRGCPERLPSPWRPPVPSRGGQLQPAEAPRGGRDPRAAWEL